MLKAAGFVDVAVTIKEESRALIAKWMPGTGAEDVVASAMLKARKPGDVSAAERAKVKQFWDGILQEEEEEEGVALPEPKADGVFGQIRRDLGGHGHGPPSAHGHGAPSGQEGGCCDDGV